MTGVWPLHILYRGGTDLYAYTADQMKNQFLERVMHNKSVPCRIDRKPIKGTISDDGYSIQWEEMKSNLPGLPMTAGAGVPITGEVHVGGGMGIGRECNGVYAWLEEHDTRPAFQSEARCILHWRNDCPACRTANAATKGAWTVSNKGGMLLYFCSGCEAGKGGDEPPQVGWESANPDAKGILETSQTGEAPTTYDLYPDERCNSTKPDIARYWWAGPKREDAHKCKTRCTLYGDECTGFLHVTNYQIPGKWDKMGTGHEHNKWHPGPTAENPAMGHCFFKRGYLDIPTPADDTQRVPFGPEKGAVTNRDEPGEVGDCYVKKPEPPGAKKIPKREYEKHSSMECKFDPQCAGTELGSSRFAGRSLLGAGKKHPDGNSVTMLGDSQGGECEKPMKTARFATVEECQQECNALGRDCGGFARIEQGDSNNMGSPFGRKKCIFYRGAPTAQTNTNPDIRDCYLLDQHLASAGKEKPAELGESQSTFCSARHWQKALEPLSRWSRMCSVNREEKAWSSTMKTLREDFTVLRDKVKSNIATRENRLKAEHKKLEVVANGENIKRTAIRSPIVKEGREKTHLELPAKYQMKTALFEQEREMRDSMKLAQRTAEIEKQHKMLRDHEITLQERNAKHAAVLAHNNSIVVKEALSKQMEKLKWKHKNVTHMVDLQVAHLTRESSRVRAFVRQHRDLFAKLAKQNALPEIPVMFAWAADLERSVVGTGECKVHAAQGLATCEGGTPMVGCLRGRLVSLNCACPGPFMYEASMRLKMNGDLMAGKCAAASTPNLKSEHEPTQQQLWDWISVCAFGTEEVVKPAPGTDCLEHFKSNQKIKEAKEAVETALIELQRSKIIMSKAQKALRKAQVAAGNATGHVAYDLSREVGEATENVVYAEGQHKYQVSKLAEAKETLFTLEMTTPTSDADVTAAQEGYEESRMMRQLKEAAVHAAKGEAARILSHDKTGKSKADKEVFRLKEEALVAQENELAAEKHLSWIIEQKKKAEKKPVELKPLAKEVKSTHPATAEASMKKAKSNEMHHKRQKKKTELEKAEKELKSLKEQERLRQEAVKMAEKSQASGDTDDSSVDVAKTHLLETQKAVFLADQSMKLIQAKLDSMQNSALAPPHIATTMATSKQAAPIESAMQDVVNGLKREQMNVAFPPRLWRPPQAYCEQNFIFATGVCVKGPLVYVQCDVGGLQSMKSLPVTVQAGCGCGGRFLHSIMVGNLEQQSKEKKPEFCVNEFTRFSELARAEFFSWNHHATCAIAIENACRQHETTLVQRQRWAQKEKLQVNIGVKMPIINNSISVYEMNVQQAQHTVDRLRQDLRNPGKWMQGVGFVKIPYLVLRSDGEESSPLTDTSLAECRFECTKNKECKSFSFKPSTGSCIMSADTLMYDEKFNCYLKKVTGVDELMTSQGGSFHIIPGMKMGDASSKAQEGYFSLQSCKLDCINADGCQSVSYSAEDGTCIRSEANLAYDEEYNYYEKEKKVIGGTDFDEPAFNKKVANERRQKAQQELEVLQQLIAWKMKTNELSEGSQSVERALPRAEAFEEERHDLDVHAANVMLPVP